MINHLKEQVLQGYHISRDEALALWEAAQQSAQQLEILCTCADDIRQYFCGNHFDICTIINGKCGSCSEDCKYCAQSSHYLAETPTYSLLNTDRLLSGAAYNQERGILRYSIVTSGRTVNPEELDQLCASYQSIQKSQSISLCASHGLLTYEQLLQLKEAGVVRYHNNLETSRRNFPAVCTTHTYDDKIATIEAAQRAGLSVCSGGIMGLGETMVDRIDMAFDLKELGVQSVPINILNPIPHTPLEDQPILSLDEVRGIVALYRFILPTTALRLAGGRELLSDKGRSVFASGANAAISGDMLTTSGIRISSDLEMIQDLGFTLSAL
ncbi:biotin synthase BioB [Aminipila butyrica]|uniref:Biotin synthase n=1 Tax=Aminipila butyrica TaxID=433296 RepID=A0A858BWA1_9FIRM|nr:biotin synthase BioB [Aminipila butyrica]QIB70213.1 biotin synthase BioB [Aminipila butyrica]